MILLGDVTILKGKFVSVCLETVLMLVQDRSMVYAKCTLGSKIFFDAPILLGDEAQVEACFGLFRYSANMEAR